MRRKKNHVDPGKAEVVSSILTGSTIFRQDHELVAAVMKIAGNGTGDTRWKGRACSTGRP